MAYTEEMSKSVHSMEGAKRKEKHKRKSHNKTADQNDGENGKEVERKDKRKRKAHRHEGAAEQQTTKARHPEDERESEEELEPKAKRHKQSQHDEKVAEQGSMKSHHHPGSDVKTGKELKREAKRARKAERNENNGDNVSQETTKALKNGTAENRSVETPHHQPEVTANQTAQADQQKDGMEKPTTKPQNHKGGGKPGMIGPDGLPKPKTLKQLRTEECKRLKMSPRKYRQIRLGKRPPDDPNRPRFRGKGKKKKRSK
ncbi:MAG: hypothetical protein M1823_000443 [Watsoniomyces obsoletus]|nr:MAG: hypothetical protein M1823_000443 [Watsoniomyces obsoletus]